MSIYIYKNNRQTGPFAESAVLEMLRNGQLSPQDFAIRQGQTEWQPLRTLFPNPAPVSSSQPPPFNNPIQSAPKKGGSSKGLLLVLLGLGVFGVLGIIGLVALYALSGNESASSANSATNQTTNAKSNGNSTVPTSNSNSGAANFKALQNKAEELAKWSPPPQIAAEPLIKGKVAIVEKGKYEAKILGFDYTGSKYSDSDVEKYGIAKVRLAVNPEEIDTLIQILCTKGKLVGRYEGGISGYANDCKVSVIDYKTPAVVAQKSFTNSTPPKSISSVYEKSGEFIFPTPDEVDEYVASFPLEKLAAPTADIPFDDDGGRYGKYKPFKDLSGELSRVAFPVNVDPNTAIKGKIAVALKEASGRTELKGFDVYGKEIYSYDHEKWGVSEDKLAEKPDEIDTLIKINCRKGDRLGAVKATTVYANRCEVSIVDYKASTVVFQKSFENKEMRKDFDTSIYPTQYIVLYPFSEIDEFIKGFPKS